MSRDAMKLALEALDCIYSPLHVREINKVGAAITALREALAEQPAPPPECQTEAEKTAFAFGWWKALEHVRQQPAQRTWVGLTFGQFHNILQNHKDIGGAMGAVEKTLREQNT